jgi:hypothetical protein
LNDLISANGIKVMKSLFIQPRVKVEPAFLVWRKLFAPQVTRADIVPDPRRPGARSGTRASRAAIRRRGWPGIPALALAILAFRPFEASGFSSDLLAMVGA